MFHVKQNNLRYETLHCHTKHSDGELTHKEVLEACLVNNIGVVAFTDHDSVPPANVLKELKSLNHKVKFIPGIEVSANNVKEVPERISLFHVAGLFVDPTNKELLNYCTSAQDKRIERANRIIKNLQNLGFDITLEDVRNFQKEGTLGRPHIAMALLSKDKNLIVLNSLVQEMSKVAEHDQEIEKQYKEVVTHDNWRKVFDLVLDDKSFVKGVYVHYLVSLSMDEAVKLIRGAGGIAVLAHWTYYKHKVNLELVERFCKEKRVDGLETVYAFRHEETSPISTEEIERDLVSLRKLVSTYDLVESGGGDFHALEDFSLMSNPALIEKSMKTIGLTKQIITKHSNIDLSWSSIG